MPRQGSLAIRPASAGSALQQELRFLNVTGSVVLDEDARATIRAQSLKDYHRKRKLLQRGCEHDIAAAPESTPQIPKKPGARVQRFRLGSGGLMPTHTQPQPTYVRKAVRGYSDKPLVRERAPARRSREIDENSKEQRIRKGQRLDISLQVAREVSSGGLDPFDALPLPSTARIRVLVQQLMVRINSNSPTRDYRRYWFQHAAQDEACFYIALCQSASDTDLTLRKGRTEEAVKYENKALQIINKRLDNPEMRVHNTTIGAVAALATYQISNGSFDAAKAHLIGMEKMVRLRGGIDDPTISTGLRRIVLWVDLIAASHDIPVPRISTYQNSSRALSPIAPDSVRRPFAECIISKKVYASAGDLIADIVNDLQILTDAKIAQHFATGTMDDEVLFGEKAYLVQRRLMELTGTSISTVSDTWTLYTFWALGASLYTSVVLFQTSLDSVIVETLVERMQLCLDTLMDKDGTAAIARAVRTDIKPFWALVLGGIASENMPQRRWFVETTRTICQLMDPCLQRASAPRKALIEGKLWDRTLDVLAERLWAEVDHRHEEEGDLVGISVD